MHNICWQYKCTQSLDSTAEQLTRTFAMLKRAGSYQTFTTSNWCNCFCQQKPPLLRGKQSKPWMSAPPQFLQWSKRSFPFSIPLTGATIFTDQNHYFREVCKVSPEKLPPLSRERGFSFSIPLTATAITTTVFADKKHQFWEVSKASTEKVPPPYPVPPFLPTKTTTVERPAKQALNKCPLSLEQSKRSFPFERWAKWSFPLTILLTGAFKIANKNHHFWEMSKASPVANK